MQSIQVKDYMTHRPVTFKEEMTVVEAAERLLIAHQIGGPVLNQYRHVIGFLSEQDCLERMLEDTYQNESPYKVADIMRTDVLCVKPEHSILDLAQSMLSNKPKIYPVVDDDNNLLGTINRSDVLKAIDRHQHAIYEQGHGRFV